jgi:uncharacterized protein (TIGR00297 family)
MNDVVSAALAFAAAGFVAFAAFRKETLALSGAFAATAVGALILLGAGWCGGVVLVTFFVTSSALSKAKARRKPSADTRHARGHRRDAVQVAANGGVATVFAVLFGLSSEPAAFAAFAGALAAATADTWATEIGGMSGQAPRLILTGERVVAGASGGVTPAGLIASLAGALLIGTVSAIGIAAGFVDDASGVGRLITAITIAGLSGSIADSLLGASAQAVFFCPVCGVETEDRVHRCGTEAKRLRGVGVINNDVVNIAATLTGAIVAGVMTL